MVQLRRITSGGRYIPEIDGLRFVAIAAVVLYHLYGPVRDAGPAGDGGILRLAAEHGYRGVNLFYVISGFILGLPFAVHRLRGQRRVELKAYFLRRLTRLEPPYILNLLVCFALLLWQGQSARLLLPHLGASLLYLHNIIFGASSPINPVAWTLEVEVQFYCLAPLLATVFAIPSKTARRALMAGLILLAGLLQKLYWHSPPRLLLTIAFAIQFFLAGFLLADFYAADWNEHPATHWAWDVASLVCWPFVFAPGDLDIWVYLPFVMLIVCMGTFQGVILRRIFTRTAVTTVGGMCYSLYLFHYQVIPAVFPFTRQLRMGTSFDLYFALQALLVAVPILVAGTLYFIVIERPCMAKDWPRRLWFAVHYSDTKP